MTQKQRLINYFLQGKELSTYSACVKKLTTKLPTRVGELKQEGFKFIVKWNKPFKSKEHNLYRLDFKNTKVKVLKPYLLNFNPNA